MALIPHYFHYIQFNLLVNKLKNRQVDFTNTIAIIFTIDVKTVSTARFSVQPVDLDDFCKLHALPPEPLFNSEPPHDCGETTVILFKLLNT